LVHGSISTMEGSVTEQFTELENALAAMVAETYAPQIDTFRTRLEELQTEVAAALDRKAEIGRAAQQARAHVAATRRLLEDVGKSKDDPPAAKRPRRQTRTARSSALETAETSGGASLPGSDLSGASAAGSPSEPASPSDSRAAGQPDA
ncbi:MAG: hypothetical protein LC772_03965, partial [Chloroflexi bacterium]|nr:hypothetical protein [Chloroflexota bacterium]